MFLRADKAQNKQVKTHPYEDFIEKIDYFSKLINTELSENNTQCIEVANANNNLKKMLPFIKQQMNVDMKRFNNPQFIDLSLARVNLKSKVRESKSRWDNLSQQYIDSEKKLNEARQLLEEKLKVLRHEYINAEKDFFKRFDQKLGNYIRKRMQNSNEQMKLESRIDRLKNKCLGSVCEDKKKLFQVKCANSRLDHSFAELMQQKKSFLLSLSGI